MATCVALQADGTLVPTGETVDTCSGYVLVSGSEYGVYQLVQQAFATPTTEQISAALTAGFGAVVLWYVIARIAGAVVSMFDN
jgi:hypothetical protein